METRLLAYLFHKVDGLMENFEGQTLKEVFDLSFSQFRVLLALNNFCTCQKDIANYWSITEAAVSRQVENLVKDGLVTRNVDQVNRRRNTLELTKKGKVKLDAASQYLNSRYKEIFNEMSPQEYENLVSILQKLIKSLN